MPAEYQLKYRPRGYRGINHETLGSDILAVVRSLKLPRLTLGSAMAARLEAVIADKWYPIGILLEATDRIDEKIGDDGLRQVGRLLFKMSHEPKGVPKTARELLNGFDALYHNANRGGDIGGWRVVAFEPGVAQLEKTTPHHCVMEEGIMGVALQIVGTPATITQKRCIRRGADHCLFDINSSIIDHRWSR